MLNKVTSEALPFWQRKISQHDATVKTMVMADDLYNSSTSWKVKHERLASPKTMGHVNKKLRVRMRKSNKSKSIPNSAVRKIRKKIDQAFIIEFK
jgi:sulfate adenylyltransferase subunit 1 (EFTu-like GTPase family)